MRRSSAGRRALKHRSGPAGHRLQASLLVATAVATNGSSTHDIGPLTSTFATAWETIWEAHHLHRRPQKSVDVRTRLQLSGTQGSNRNASRTAS